MAQRGGGKRPTGTDGSDYRFRQTVEQRFKNATLYRARLRTLLGIQLAYHVFVAVWSCLPLLLRLSSPALLSPTTWWFATMGLAIVALGATVSRRQADPSRLHFFAALSLVVAVSAILISDDILRGYKAADSLLGQYIGGAQDTTGEGESTSTLDLLRAQERKGAMDALKASDRTLPRTLPVAIISAGVLVHMISAITAMRLHAAMRPIVKKTA